MSSLSNIYLGYTGPAHKRPLSSGSRGLLLLTSHCRQQNTLIAYHQFSYTRLDIYTQPHQRHIHSPSVAHAVFRLTLGEDPPFKHSTPPTTTQYPADPKHQHPTLRSLNSRTRLLEQSPTFTNPLLSSLFEEPKQRLQRPQPCLLEAAPENTRSPSGVVESTFRATCNR